MNTLILPAINFLILIGFITYKTKTPFVEFMRKRSSDVYDGLNRSKIQAAEVAARKKDVEAKLLSLDSERTKIAQEWKEKEAAHVVNIRDSSTRVIAQMKKEAEQNKVSFEATLHSEILKNFRKNVILQSETKIKAAMNSEIQNKMNSKFVERVASA